MSDSKTPGSFTKWVYFFKGCVLGTVNSRQTAALLEAQKRGGPLESLGSVLSKSR